MLDIAKGLSNVVLVLLWSRAGAQTGHGFETLEALISRANVVFTGTLEQVDWDAHANYTLTIKVDQVIKGKVGSTATLTRHSDGAYQVYKDAAAQHAKLMLFQGPGEGNYSIKDWWSLRLVPGSPSGRDGYGWRETPVFNQDMEIVDNLGKAIEVARAFVRRWPGIYEWHSLTLPWPIAAKYGGGGSAVYYVLAVPITPGLETIALKIIRDPKSFFKPGSDVEQRWQQALRVEGIKALAHFKSDRNIRLLKRYLNDPYKGWIAAKPDYPIRRAAQDVLMGWGVK